MIYVWLDWYDYIGWGKYSWTNYITGIYFLYFLKKVQSVFWMGIEEKNPPHFTCYVPISSGAGRIDDESYIKIISWAIFFWVSNLIISLKHTNIVHDTIIFSINLSNSKKKGTRTHERPASAAVLCEGANWVLWRLEGANWVL